MALEAAIDRALDSMLSRLNPMFSRLLPLLRRFTLLIGLLFGLPFCLFLLLVSSDIFHWWHFPWSEQGMLWLFQGMTIGAAVNVLIFGGASVLFFAAWWRKKLRVPVQKRPRMAVSYTLTPLFYWLVIGWGITTLQGHTKNIFAYEALVVFTLMIISLTCMRSSEHHRPNVSAA